MAHILTLESVNAYNRPDFQIGVFMLSEIINFLSRVLNDNDEHVNEITDEHIRMFAEPKPLATVLMCSDSRVQKIAFDRSSEHDLFIVRNIGNQVLTAPGSVEYGVRRLNTKVLLIMGHSCCAAITSGMADYNHLPARVKVELDTLNVTKNKSVAAAVVDNVHQQVEKAMQMFNDLVTANSLTIVGAVYDFSNDFHAGHGRLIVIDVNNERDGSKIASMLKMENEGKFKFGLDVA